MKVKSEFLTESKSLRETVINRLDVLDKVKKLMMLPGDLYITVEMAANYYEVHKDAIEKAVRLNRSELTEDGMKVLRGDALSALKAETYLSKRIPSVMVLPRRAVLRIGMLLQESEVAKAIRSHLLDVEEEKVSPVMPDYSGLSPMLQALIAIEHRQNAFEKRQTLLEEENAKQKEEITVIKETLLTRDDDWRRAINSMLNAAAFRIGGKYADLRKESYDRLEERAHCNLKSRLTRLHKRLEETGATKSKIENTTRMDVIEADDKLKEIYTAIVKELSIGSLKLVGGNHA